MLLDEYDVIPWKVLNFLGASINYGGRVTDAQDVNLISRILETFMNDKILIDGHKFSGLFYILNFSFRNLHFASNRRPEPLYKSNR